MGLGQVQALSMTKLLWARCRRVLSIDKWISGEVHGLLSTTKLVWARCMQVLSIDKMGLGQVLGGFVNDKTAWGEVCEGFVNWQNGFLEVYGLLSMTKLAWARCRQVCQLTKCVLVIWWLLSMTQTCLGQVYGGLWLVELLQHHSLVLHTVADLKGMLLTCEFGTTSHISTSPLFHKSCNHTLIGYGWVLFFEQHSKPHSWATVLNLHAPKQYISRALQGNHVLAAPASQFLWPI